MSEQPPSRLLCELGHDTPTSGCFSCFHHLVWELDGCVTTLGRLHSAVVGLFRAAGGEDYDAAVAELTAAQNAVGDWARTRRQPFGNAPAKS